MLLLLLQTREHARGQLVLLRVRDVRVRRSEGLGGGLHLGRRDDLPSRDRRLREDTSSESLVAHVHLDAVHERFDALTFEEHELGRGRRVHAERVRKLEERGGNRV